MEKKENNKSINNNLFINPNITSNNNSYFSMPINNKISNENSQQKN